MSGNRLAIFLSVALSIWGLVHLYLFWRLSSVPWIADHVSRKTLIINCLVLWVSYVLARMVGHLNFGGMASGFEFAASAWLGLAFLMFAALLVVDVLTLGGNLFPSLAPTIRGWAALGAGLLAVIALVQGLRAPVVTRHEVRLAGLPPERDGLRLVVISDLHLGRLLGERWLLDRAAQVNALNPDCVLAVGDVVDGSARHLEPLIPALRQLRAPLGVWAVTGNHEFYEGLEHSLQVLRQAGWRVLRDESAEVAPGLVLAGVDDLTARRQFGLQDTAVEKALMARPPGATILLSHSPLDSRKAAALGAGLMLSGHTHAGQIWPFIYLVQLRYPLVSGRYEVEGMPVFVCRGTGTWGPRMRLWQRSEILFVTLRSKAR